MQKFGKNVPILKTLHKVFLVVLISLFFTYAWPVNASLAASSCPVGDAMSKVELYFGLDIPGGGKVDSVAWQRFVDKEVTPRFPAGLTIDEVSGQWQDVKTSKTIRESSRAMMILYKPSAKAERAIENIRAAYKSQFQQDAVMRLDEINCVSF